MMMKAARLHAIGHIQCDTVPIPQPSGQELLIRVGACGICGSDLPRTFEHGSSNGKYPLVIGHEFAGEVVAVGPEADASLIGAKGAIFPLIPCRECESCITGNYAMCENYDYLGSRRDGGFAQYCLIPSAWHFIPSRRASLQALAMTEPACVAQHAIHRAKVIAGQFVILYGAGAIGIMAARWVEHLGAKALLADIDDEKVAFARSHGLDAINCLRENAKEAVRKRNGGRLADAGVEGTGADKALQGCVECVRARGNISLLGNPADRTVLPLGHHSMLMRKEINVHGVWNSSRSPWPVDEWNYTVQMMDEGRFQVEDLITDRFSLEELPTVLQGKYEGTRKGVKSMCIL